MNIGRGEEDTSSWAGIREKNRMMTNLTEVAHLKTHIFPCRAVESIIDGLVYCIKSRSVLTIRYEEGGSGQVLPLQPYPAGHEKGVLVKLISQQGHNSTKFYGSL